MDHKDKAWSDAKKKYRLSVKTVSMAKKLGLNLADSGTKCNMMKSGGQML